MSFKLLLFNTELKDSSKHAKKCDASLIEPTSFSLSYGVKS